MYPICENLYFSKPSHKLIVFDFYTESIAYSSVSENAATTVLNQVLLNSFCRITFWDLKYCRWSEDCIVKELKQYETFAQF